jgi:ribosomal protein S7
MRNQKDERIIPVQLVKNYFRKGVKAKGVRRVFQTLINIKERYVLDQNKIFSAEKRLANQLMQKKRLENANRINKQKKSDLKVLSNVTPVVESEETELREIRDYKKLIFRSSLKKNSNVNLQFKVKLKNKIGFKNKATQKFSSKIKTNLIFKHRSKHKMEIFRSKFKGKEKGYIFKLFKITDNNKIRFADKIRYVKRLKYNFRFNKIKGDVLKVVCKFRPKIFKPYLLKLNFLSTKTRFKKKFQKKFRILKDRGLFSAWFLKQAISNCRWRVFLRSRWVAGKRMKVPFFTTLLRDTRYACKNFIKSIVDRSENPFLPGLLKELYLSLVLKSTTVKKRVLAYRTLYATSLYTGAGYKTSKRRKRINRY